MYRKYNLSQHNKTNYVSNLVSEDHQLKKILQKEERAEINCVIITRNQ